MSLSVKGITMKERLQNARKQHKLTQKKAAEDIFNIPLGTLSGIESGRITPPIEYVCIACYKLLQRSTLERFITLDWAKALLRKKSYRLSYIFEDEEDLFETIISLSRTYPGYILSPSLVVEYRRDHVGFVMPSYIDRIPVPPTSPLVNTHFSNERKSINYKGEKPNNWSEIIHAFLDLKSLHDKMGNILNKIDYLQKEIQFQTNEVKNSKENVQDFNDLFIYELQLRNEISIILSKLTVDELEQVKSLLSSFDIFE
ncbi:helix-turn-helix transcriptional regulator [Lysinibacillus sp. CNPSo 3705]|uniref:helix-turn-helix domain-containing protein n=1 Tax=Lysinibacillus sp. CNPSo 3705 TaxID=3028148 RepID=UPI002363D983|nr:helix-turn-helix transcriptional regulator [Lysinibacillus sp. CNPSo 3705]MDD1505079.1 helix-turn-helix transcriptional regulator [Lysinibacillus sp. CNPSo 3705]